MIASELRKKTVDVLNDEVNGLMQEQFNLRMQKGSGQLTQTHRLKEIRRDLARIKTILNEKTKEQENV